MINCNNPSHLGSSKILAQAVPADVTVGCAHASRHLECPQHALSGPRASPSPSLSREGWADYPQPQLDAGAPPGGAGPPLGCGRRRRTALPHSSQHKFAHRMDSAAMLSAHVVIRLVRVHFVAVLFMLDCFGRVCSRFILLHCS